MLDFIKNFFYKPQTINTLSISNYKSATSVKLTSDIVYGQKVTVRGVCWNTTGDPTFSNDHTYDSAGYGTYNSIVINLRTGTTYFFRSYYTNGKDFFYSKQIKFTTAIFYYDFENSNFSWNHWYPLAGKGNRGIYPDYQPYTSSGGHRVVWVKEMVQPHQDGLWLVASTGNTKGSDWQETPYYNLNWWQEGVKHDFCGQICSYNTNVNSGFTFKYGRLDILAKLPPSGFTYFPSFWLYNSDPGDQKPEVDFEIFGKAGQGNQNTYMLGGPTNFMKFSYHHPNGSVGGEYTFKNTLDKDFHTYSLIWTASKLSWLVDNVEYYSTTVNIPTNNMLLICGIQAGSMTPDSGTYTYIFNDNECNQKIVIKRISITKI